MSVKVRLALKLPVEPGSNVTAAVQLAPAARPPVQFLVVNVKSEGFAPPLLTPVNVIEVAPVLVMVTLCGLLLLPSCTVPKLRLLGTNCITVPVPLSGTDWGLPEALSVMETFALKFPEVAGVKVTVIVQLAPGPRLEPQLWLWLKALALAPPMLMPPMLNVLPPLLVSVTVWPGLLVLINCVANCRLEGESWTPGPLDAACSITEMLAAPLSDMAKSGRPSPLKSATATPAGLLPVE